MIKVNFVFDLDGTLIDSSYGIYDSYIKALKEANLNIKEIDFYNFKKNIGPPFEIMIKSIHPNLNLEERTLLNDKFRKIFDSVGFLNYKIYTKIPNCIQNLSEKGNSLYILSNKRYIPTQTIINNEFPNIFKNVWGKNNNSFNKFYYLNKLKCEKKEEKIFYIGDTLKDKKAAEKAKVNFIYAKYGFGDIPKNNDLIICERSSDLKSLLMKFCVN